MALGNPKQEAKALDAEQVQGTARNAVSVVVAHLDAARQVLALLETGD
ncbi:hypothetical protein [Arthrobacter sp.]|nr:hypothetical protein [Arthrobacter sp.]MDO5752461.1 hypothetical protein [Arthrobacter sp.]